MIVRAAGVILLAAWLMSSGAMPDDSHFPDEPESYRGENYRAPTPAALRGARVVSTFEAEAIWRARAAAFVDVLPQVSRPPDLPVGTLWRGQRRRNIPGSIWLPDTGYGEPSAAAQDYLRFGLQRVTGGNRAIPLVIYLPEGVLDVMERRKAGGFVGIQRVIWYPDGTDGWQDAGLLLAAGTPAAPPGE